MQSPDVQFDPLHEQNLTKSLNLVKAVAGEIHRRLPREVEYDDLYLLTRHQRQQLKKDDATDFPVPILISSSAPRLPDGNDLPPRHRHLMNLL